MLAVTVRVDNDQVVIEQDDHTEDGTETHTIRLHHDQVPLFIEWLQQANKACEEGE